MPSIKKNIIYQSVYQILALLLPLIVAPYISRVLGAERVGIYSYINATASYFIYFSMLGIKHHGSRTIAAIRQNREILNKKFSELFIFQFCVSLFVLILYVLFIIVFVNENKLYYSVFILMVLSAVFDITWFFSGLEQFKIIVTRSTFIRILTVACIFIFVKTDNDLWKYSLIMCLGTLLGNLFVWFFIKRYVSFVKPDWVGIKHHIKPIILLFIPVISISVYHVLNKIILGAMSDKVQLGLYSNSEKIILIPISFVYAFNGVITPRMAHLGAKNDKTSQNKLTLISMKYVMILAFASAFGIAGISKGFAPLFFGEEFRACGYIIIYLCVSIPFLSFSNLIATQHLIPNSKDKFYTICTIIGAITNILANLIFIPHFQAIGAAIGTVLAESVRCIIMGIAIRKALPIWSYIKNSLPFLFNGIIMFVFINYIGSIFDESVLTVLFQIAIGAVLYLVLSAIYLYLTKDQFFIDNLRKFFKMVGFNK